MTFVARYLDGARAEAASRGYTLRVVENDFDQTQQDAQVQQQLASAGPPPAAYLWWPSDNRAGVASLRRLHRTDVPVVQVNQRPDPSTAEFFDAYSGPDDTAIGEAAASLVLTARDLVAERTGGLHGPGGNLLVVAGLPGYQATVDRLTGLEAGLRDAPMTVVRTVEADGFSAQDAYEAVSQSFQSVSATGVDVVYAIDGNVATGTIRALREAGLSPGENVAVVAGSCTGGGKEGAAGEVFGSPLHAPELEGRLAVAVTAGLLEGDGRTDGEEWTAPVQAEAIPALDRIPARYNFLPHPPVEFAFGDPARSRKAADEFRFWGADLATLCAW